MSRIASCFASLKSQNRKALIPYIMAGDPAPEVTVPLLHAIVAAGADLIELGLPFSDPMADGPVIALAAERALAGGTSTFHAIDMVAEFRKTNTTTPIVLMGYLNPIEIIGYEAFAARAAQAGVDGLLLVDLPPEEAGELGDILAKHEIDPIFLLAPTTTDARIEHVVKAARGYVYYVSLKGVTGSSALDTDEVAQRIRTIKQKTDLPIGVGFGIHDRQTAQAVGAAADGVIVGTVLVRAFAENDVTEAQAKIVAKVQELRLALDDL
ncbi:tryptophan synthase subunit alpha [Aquirhabdus parva]|uniref:Tryptophan synthase alpha chain n=1 Tax=Aquirhabdus parva TaxID=2283318 RepID=A0A345P444_9GAMM|nr:tryptophan synthase subunit alpha [Aquirhabdus parva]AXI02053.1 tryptophan synthase subunit alpha [Aquirhabdus parva]